MIEELTHKISPLISNGLSIDVALKTSNIIDVSSSTIRRYINKELLTVKRIDLPSAVRFKAYKKQSNTTSKLSPRILYKRTYEDFMKYIACHPKSRIIQLDSVLGKSTDKTAILTLCFNHSKFQFAFKYNRKASDVNDIVLNLYKTGIEQGYPLFDVILTDNGSEFKNLIELENDENNKFRFKVFYCDPYCSFQKAECERNHGLIRRIIKKGRTLDKLSQLELYKTMNPINSYARGS